MEQQQHEDLFPAQGGHRDIPTYARPDVIPPPHPVNKDWSTHLGAHGIAAAGPTLGDGLKKIGDGITSITSGIVDVTTIISGWLAAWSASPAANADPEIAKVQTVPGRSVAAVAAQIPGDKVTRTEYASSERPRGRSNRNGRR